MYKINDYVVYRTTVCQITEIKQNYFNDLTYYQLEPIEETTLVLHVSVNNPAGYLRPVISKKEAVSMIVNMDQTELIPGNANQLESSYKMCMAKGTLEDLMRVYMTSNKRICERKVAGKKVLERDRNYYERAKKCLYDEFSIALKLDMQKTDDYIQEYLK